VGLGGARNTSSSTPAANRQGSQFSAQDRKGLKIAGVSIAIMIGLGGLAIYLAGPKPDPETLCPEDRPLVAHTVVLVDKTDPLTEGQFRYLKEKILGARDRLVQFEKFSIFVLDDKNYMSPEPLFSKCNPGRGDEANPFYQNPRKIQKKFDAFFEQPLEDTLKDLKSVGVASRSPIMEMIREISYRKDFSNQVPERRMILVSDLMENMPDHYTQYAGTINYEFFTEQPYAGELKANLSQVKVDIGYLMRNGMGLQTNDHVLFWYKYLAAQGASVSGIRKVRWI